MVLWRGEMWQELFMRGAWDGIEKRPNRVQANREHDKGAHRRQGHQRSDPSRPEGLVAEVKIAKTPLGDETLALADEDCLGVVGRVMRPRPSRCDRGQAQPKTAPDQQAFWII